jgi:superfamily II DNA or RNA helicase
LESTSAKNEKQHAATALSLAMSPQGRLYLDSLGGSSEESNIFNENSRNRIKEGFEKNQGLGLLVLAGDEITSPLPPVFSYFREIGLRYLTEVCRLPEDDANQLPKMTSPRNYLEALSQSPPLMRGAEYLNADVLEALWREMDEAFREEAMNFSEGVKSYIQTRYPRWHMVGRVCFHLAENKSNPDEPFAFLATYTTRLSAQAKPQHLPLATAINQSKDARDRSALLSLLLPIQRAGEKSALVKEMVESGEIYHPCAWTPDRAYQFLKEIPIFESSGLTIRVPDWWKSKRPPRPEVSIRIGNKTGPALGIDSMLDFQMSVTLDGDALTPQEYEELLSAKGGLALIRGRWVEVDPDRLKETLAHWKTVEQGARISGISFIDGMRLLSGASIDSQSALPQESIEWTNVRAGEWLSAVLQNLKSPSRLDDLKWGEGLQARLRPYQEEGVKWLWLLNRIGLSGCLADDMGLGKTIQVIALFLLLKNEIGHEKTRARRPNLLVLPASLIANWKSELERFAPSLNLFFAHPSVISASELKEPPAQLCERFDVVLTSYGTLLRLSWLQNVDWDVVVLDEAQAIKNPTAKQTRAAKNLKSRMRLALTGTPVENRLSDLWSIFDFLQKGLLGSAKAFTEFSKQLGERKENPYGPLRELVRPYILRRLKTDKSIIADLPDKTEVRAYCPLTKLQAALYAESVNSLSKEIKISDGIRRRGVILAYLMRFKQICNHPSQWLGDGEYDGSQSGKFVRLEEICCEIAARQEKCLIFTQFREITDVLCRFLSGIFNRAGLVLHGETPVKKRKEIVDCFQNELGPPFLVLSLKAGGTGLNLTQASHVIHFDRWWNPAVEDQATDRAFRIGQKKNVLVHKFVCRGTVEDKIDEIIESKKATSRELLEGGTERLLTEMNNEDLMRLVSLDLNRALEEK